MKKRAEKNNAQMNQSQRETEQIELHVAQN